MASSSLSSSSKPNFKGAIFKCRILDYRSDEKNFVAFATGTCFSVSNKGLLLTYAHTFQNMKKSHFIELWVEGEGHAFAVCNPNCLVYRDTSTDLAILQLRTESIRNNIYAEMIDKGIFLYLDLKSADKLDIGDKLTIVGFPGNTHALVFTEGILSTKDFPVGPGQFKYRTDACGNPGNSGGPVFLNKRYVVGIMTDTVRLVAFPDQNDQNSTLFMPLQHIKKSLKDNASALIQRVKVREELKKMNQIWDANDV